MIFKQLFEPESCTYTYLVACEHTREAALIDPVVSEVEVYVALIEALGLKLIFTLETHVHADHVTGADALRRRLGSRSVVHKDAGAACGDRLVSDGERIQVGTLSLEVRHTPGHTNGCVSYVMADRVFTGDALLIDGCGRTDFQAGDPGQLWDSIHGKLFTLPDATQVFPGHDYKGRTHSSIGQERANNARLGHDRSRADFIALMGELHLPYPKKIQEALPANQACGRMPGLSS